MLNYEFERQPIIVKFPDPAKYTETYGFTGNQGYVFLEGQLLVPRGVKSDTLHVFMHPASTLNLMPATTGLAQAGRHVLCGASRYARNDSALIMENTVADLGAYMKYTREQLGYKKVILMGWSGGGSLAMLFQSQALKPTITQTPAGDPIDLTKAGLIPADKVIFIAAHIGRAKILSEWIDPSVQDEGNTRDRSAELDLYNPQNPNKPPYNADFIEQFRKAQLERQRRITAWVKDELKFLREAGGKEQEKGFVVERTMADPRWLDPSIDPNARTANSCYLGDPETVNTGPAGLARFCTLRSWLSQWSIDDTNADAVRCAKTIDTPLLLIENEADDAVPPSHTGQVFAAAASVDKTMYVVKEAEHYFQDQPEKSAEAVKLCIDWSEA